MVSVTLVDIFVVFFFLFFFFTFLLIFLGVESDPCVLVNNL